MPLTHSKTTRAAGPHRRLAAPISAMLLPLSLLLLGLLSSWGCGGESRLFVSASLFASPSGLMTESALLVDGVDVATAIRTLQVQMAEQAAINVWQQEEIDALRRNLTAATTIIQQQAGDINTIMSAALTIQMSLEATNLTHRVFQLESAVDMIQTNIDSLQLYDSNNTAIVSSLDTRISAAELAASDLAARVAVLENTTAIQSTQIAALQAAVTNINEVEIVSLVASLASLNTSLVQDESLLSLHSAELVALASASVNVDLPLLGGIDLGTATADFQGTTRGHWFVPPKMSEVAVSTSGTYAVHFRGKIADLVEGSDHYWWVGANLTRNGSSSMLSYVLSGALGSGETGITAGDRTTSGTWVGQLVAGDLVQLAYLIQGADSATTTFTLGFGPSPGGQALFAYPLFTNNGTLTTQSIATAAV